MISWKEILSVSLVLFSVIDILGSLPVVISLRKKFGHIHSGKATLISGVIMIIFLFLGTNILALFSLDISSFAIAGAFVMFLIGMEMVLGLELFRHEPDTNNTASIFPLAFPLIAGAGTMTTLLSLKSEYHTNNIIIGIILNLAFIYVVLKTSIWLEAKIGKAGLNIIRKVFGIILLSISIKMFKNHLVL